MMNRSFTTAELADRWYDLREITNLAGKYVTSLLLKQESQIYDRFWTREAEPCLSFNDGSYLGANAVQSFYSAAAEHVAAVSRALKELFPAQLGACSEQELYGTGQFLNLPLTTGVVEIADDGLTAKGLWHVQGSNSTVTPSGPSSTWLLGFLAVDFRREGDDWKLWHVLHATDIAAPMGQNWLVPSVVPAVSACSDVPEIELPHFTLRRQNHSVYHPQRPFTAPPPVPEPYATFADTFSYGI